MQPTLIRFYIFLLKELYLKPRNYRRRLRSLTAMMVKNLSFDTLGLSPRRPQPTPPSELTKNYGKESDVRRNVRRSCWSNSLELAAYISCILYRASDIVGEQP
jgi:hypothetical protein